MKHKKTSENKKESRQVIQTWILSLIIIQIILSLVIILGVNSNESNIDFEQLDLIESKVNAIDSFFASNVDGYNGNTAPSQGNNAPPSNNPENVDLDIENEPTLGNPDALVTIVEFSDYECPFCQRFYSETLNQIKAEYIDTGKVKLVYKDFPLSFHQNAKPAAIAANCVYEELGDEKYFEFHDKLFENQQSLSQSNFKKWALEIGANENKYESCIIREDISNEIDLDLAEGSKYGVSGTPSFFINGELIVGAQPYSAIKQIIDSKLN